MADIVEDETAIYGLHPSKTGSLAAYADADWSDAERVAKGRQDRIEYHRSLETMYELLNEMTAEGKSAEEIARVISAKRNQMNGWICGRSRGTCHVKRTEYGAVRARRRTFIQNMVEDEKDVRLVELILDIAKNLKVPVTAEGVETKGQVTLLKRLGCVMVQGYYFSRPLPVEKFETEILKKAI